MEITLCDVPLEDMTMGTPLKIRTVIMGAGRRMFIREDGAVFYAKRRVAEQFGRKVERWEFGRMYPQQAGEVNLLRDCQEIVSRIGTTRNAAELDGSAPF